MAVLAGVVTRFAFALMLDDAAVFYYTQEAVAYVLPQSVSDRAFGVVVSSLALSIRVLPAVVVAMLVMVWMRPHGDGFTRCGACGHILKGLSQPRCPECGESI